MSAPLQILLCGQDAFLSAHVVQANVRNQTPGGEAAFVWCLTESILSSSSFIQHLWKHKSYVAASSYPKLLAKLVQATPWDTGLVRDQDTQPGRWRSRLGAEEAQD